MYLSNRLPIANYDIKGRKNMTLNVGGNRGFKTRASVAVSGNGDNTTIGKN